MKASKKRILFGVCSLICASAFAAGPGEAPVSNDGIDAIPGGQAPSRDQNGTSPQGTASIPAVAGAPAQGTDGASNANSGTALGDEDSPEPQNEAKPQGEGSSKPEKTPSPAGSASNTAPAFEESPSDPCHYTSYAWDTRIQKATGRVAYAKTKGELTPEERDPHDPRCTVCSEDQVEIALPHLPKIRICKYYADQVREALMKIDADPSFTIHQLEGYRPGKTRGPIVDGKRSQFSNHSYGTAIDINAGQNAMYNKCKGPRKDETDLDGCKKSIGGPWRPKANPKESIARGGVVYTAFSFWKWGGDLPGQLKDFMHFSITGE